ncbi:hypothetical protein Pmani_037414 [Petrolisthes manimaculis]|uniref:Uncharacterized protein n=1 Tax=Petrolisthes manimaculis TaxID=1843537 RepID=A0AAE1NID6_9EUCA|nr:hypothetical protein Pmani_037414 [Petrolisthes manimaculis]
MTWLPEGLQGKSWTGRQGWDGKGDRETWLGWKEDITGRQGGKGRQNKAEQGGHGWLGRDGHVNSEIRRNMKEETRVAWVRLYTTGRGGLNEIEEDKQQGEEEEGWMAHSS